MEVKNYYQNVASIEHSEESIKQNVNCQITHTPKAKRINLFYECKEDDNYILCYCYYR